MFLEVQKKALSKLGEIKNTIMKGLDFVPKAIDKIVNGIKNNWFTRTFLGSKGIDKLNSIKNKIIDGVSSLNNYINRKLGQVIGAASDEIAKEAAEKAAKEQARKAVLAKSSKKSVQKPPKNRKFSGLENRGYKPKPG